MKKYIYILAFSVLSIGLAQAQQPAIFNHGYYKPFIYNPSYAGADNQTSIFAFSRNQWTGINGAPTSHAVTADGSLKDDKAGLGGTLIYDNWGLFTNISALGSFAYRVKLSDKSNMAFGVSAGLLSTNYDFSNAIVKDANDPILVPNTTTSFDGVFGMHINISKLQLGIALPHLFAGATGGFNNKQNVYYNLARQYVGNAKYNIIANENTRIVPQVTLRAEPSTPFQYDANVVAYFKKDKYWAGIQYRSYKAISPMLGVKLYDQLVMGYTYDYALGGSFNPQVAQTHEVMLGYVFKKREDKVDSAKGCCNSDCIKQLQKDRDSVMKVLEDHEKRIDSLEMHEDDIAALRKTLSDFKKLMQTSEGRSQIAVGDQYILKTVYFDSNKDVKDSDVPELNELADILKSHPTFNIQLSGHTDDVGTDEYNNGLSQHRAEWAMKYIISKGVDKGRLTAMGYGKKFPIVSNRTPKGRGLNRRVEFVVTKK